MDLVLSGKLVTIISVYEPQSGRSERNKDRFHDDLSAETQSKIALYCGILMDMVEAQYKWLLRNSWRVKMGNLK